MRKKGLDDIQHIIKNIDNILDMYFDELINCFERKKDIQGLRGWLRINLHMAIKKTHPVKESDRTEYVYHGIVAILIISIINMLLSFFRYIVDPY